jgi:hypothetical protein
LHQPTSSYGPVTSSPFLPPTSPTAARPEPAKPPPFPVSLTPRPHPSSPPLPPSFLPPVSTRAEHAAGRDFKSPSLRRLARNLRRQGPPPCRFPFYPAPHSVQLRLWLGWKAPRPAMATAITAAVTASSNPDSTSPPRLQMASTELPHLPLPPQLPPSFSRHRPGQVATGAASVSRAPACLTAAEEPCLTPSSLLSCTQDTAGGRPFPRQREPEVGTPSSARDRPPVRPSSPCVAPVAPSTPRTPW